MHFLPRFLDPTTPSGLAIAVGVVAALFAIWMILRGPRVVSVLILKYLRKRRIAWVSLIAVVLCTLLVLVVISVMGGWLRMFRLSFHGLAGDIQVVGQGLGGFSNYEQMVDRIEQLPEVGKGNAVPVIHTYGLINFNNRSADKVQVLGYPMDKIGNVNNFPQSLYRQGTASREWAAEEIKRIEKRNEAGKITPSVDDSNYIEYLKLKAVEPLRPPSFALLEEAFTGLDKLPVGIVFPVPPPTTAPSTTAPAATRPTEPRVRYDATNKLLILRGVMTDPELAALQALSNDPAYQKALHELYIKCLWDVVRYRGLLPKARVEVDVTHWPGMIPGVGVLGIHKDRNGDTVNRSNYLYRLPVKLTVLGIDANSRNIDLGGKSERNYWMVDDSRTRVYLYDSTTVYVPFDVLQKDLRMDATPATADSPATPARTSELNIRVQPTANLDATRDKIATIVQQVLGESSLSISDSPVTVQTWEQSQRTYLSAIENEKVLVTFLFGLISLVAVFLIFCIFYMIVVEKTRDIGIVKSVGATSMQIAGIFLGYGLAIGLVGAGLGLLCGYLIVHNINELHAWMGKALGIVIWNPEVYQFDSIPNTMNPPEVAVILMVAVGSAVLGALLPAIRAARLHPVEALRWE